MRLPARIRRFLVQGDFRRGVLTLVGGASIAQLIVIASSPVLTRLYSPTDVGAYAVAASLLSVLVTVTCLRYELAVPLPESDVAAADVLALSLLTNLGMSVATLIVLFVAGPSLLALFGASALSPFLWLLPLGQFGGGAVLALTGWAIRTRSFGDIAKTRLTQSGTLAAVQIGLGAGGFGAPGLLIGDVAGRFSGSSRLATAAWRSSAESFRHVSRGGIRAAARRYRRFPILSGGSALLNTLGEQAPLLLFVALFGSGVGGQFALAQRVSAVPVTLVAGAVGQVFVSRAARLAREEPAELRTLFGRTTRSLALGAIGPFVLIALLAPTLAAPVFGDAWRDAGLFVAILAPMFYLQLVTSPTGGTLDVLERQDLHLARELFRLGTVAGAVVIAASMRLSPFEALVVLSVAGCLTYSVYGLLSWRAILSHRARA